MAGRGTHKVSVRRTGSFALLAVATVLLSISTPFEKAATAASYTCGTRSNYFDGFFHNTASGYSFEGASSFIVARFAGLCGTDYSQINNFSNSWAMIASSNTDPTACEWAQSGFERGYVSGGGTNIRHFAQIAGGCSNVQTHYSATYIAANNRHTYQSTYHPNCGCLQVTVDGNLYLQSNFNPYQNNVWKYPFVPQFFGETSYTANDMPGTPSSPTAFTGVGAQNVSNDALVPMPCTMIGRNDNATSWARAATACDSFTIWTK